MTMIYTEHFLSLFIYVNALFFFSFWTITLVYFSSRDYDSISNAHAFMYFMPICRELKIPSRSLLTDKIEYILNKIIKYVAK